MTESDATPAAETPAMKALRRGLDWFCAQEDERFLAYRFHVEKDAWSTERHPLREVASLWSIAKGASFLKEPRYAKLAARGFDYFEAFIAVDDATDSAWLTIPPGDQSISYNSFLILAHMELERPNSEETVARLARGLLRQQRRDGSFATYFNPEHESNLQYFPGQTMLALMALFEKTGIPAYKDAVAAAFPFYRQFWRDDPNTPMVPWHSQALYRLYQAEPNPDVAAFVFEMSDYLLDSARDPENPERFRFGGIIAAVHCEGLAKACLIAQHYGDMERAKAYARYVQLAMTAVLTLQSPLPGQSAEDLPPPALGGFHALPQEPILRVDHNQHAVMALMAGLEAGLIR